MAFGVRYELESFLFSTKHQCENTESFCASTSLFCCRLKGATGGKMGAKFKEVSNVKVMELTLV